MTDPRGTLRAGDWRIDELEPATAPEADLLAVHRLMVALEREALPDVPVPPAEHALAEYRRAPAFRHRRWWVSRHGDFGETPNPGDEVVGWATCVWHDLPDNRSHCEVDVAVAPSVRGRGLGSALFAAVVEAAARWDASLLDIYARVGGPGEPFLRRIGAELRQVERRSACLTSDLDRPMLERWVRRAGERAANYSLIGWDGPCPDDLLPAVCDLVAVMNTAPRDDLEWDDQHITPDVWREREAASDAQGFDSWRLCARHDDSGELAGFTELSFPRRWPEMAYQGDTGVWPKHRDRGLGRWLKAAMALRLVDERPAVTRIETWNAGGNQPMLAINEAMGFAGLENWGAWQVPVARARSALAS
ncbi:MAG: GNAT family N-acetyltransferase [Actinomycetota bacterium]|nr:GNAT family N-acetyltransferase [Actinomycetota bacterium]